MPSWYCALDLRVRYPLGGPVGGVAGLVTDGGEEVGIVRVEPCVRACASCLHDGIEVDWVSRPVGSGKRVRLNRKPPAHHERKSFSGASISHWCVEEIEGSWFSGLGAC